MDTTDTTAQNDVRIETRAAYTALRQTGESPSVRKVFAMVGGTYGIVARELKVLRDEQADDEPDDTVSAVPLDDPRCDVAGEQAGVLKAEAALAAARAQLETLTAALAQAEQDFALAEEAAGIGLSRQILEGVVPTEVQKKARTARAEALLEVEDLTKLVHKQEEEVVRQAEAALADAQRRVKTAQLNALQLAGPALAAQYAALAAPHDAALEALLTHNAEVLRLAVELGLQDVFSATPFAARVTEPRLPIPVNASGWGLLNQIVYERLEKILPIPAYDPHSRSRIRGVTLDTLSEAFSQLLDLDQDGRRGGDRRFPTRLRPDLSPEARNWIPLAGVGLPGVLSTYGPVVLTREQFERLHAAMPSWIIDAG